MAQYTPAYQPNGTEIAVIKTSKGDIRVRLAGTDAPVHVGNFVELANKGFYDNLKFHRHVPGFVIQGGCPNTRDLSPEEVAQRAGSPFSGLGTGGPGYTIKEEFTTNPHNKHLDGALAMARSQDPNSAGSQFYLCLGPQHALDDGYTVFGQAIDGLEVIRELRVGDVIEGVGIEGATAQAAQAGADEGGEGTDGPEGTEVPEGTERADS
ncbi:MAG: peptidylprolyl isomerase [Coriobacteriaceae bacterium]|jgi:peptidyl-prolyl cis-trans isomerase B (cyclophilin B)|nr:peptidylprolyl isomerase [Coriobacteriaceae bacterium]